MTNTLIRTFALICVLAFPPSAKATLDVDSGATFYPQCWNYWAGRDEDSFGDAHKTGFCKGYVKAATNALLSRSREPVICIPREDLSMEMIHQIIRRYFEDHPEMLHENVDVLIGMALGAAYPCGGTR